MKNKIKNMFVLCIALLILSITSSSEAQTSWCYRYTSYDSFENYNYNNWGNWGLWNSSFTGLTSIGSMAINKSPPAAVSMRFAVAELYGGFMALDRYFTLSGDATERFNGCGGGTIGGPFPVMPKNAKFCSAEVSFYAPQGAHVGLQILDPETYVILASKEFDSPALPNWIRVWTPDVPNCSQNLVIRLSLVRMANSKSIYYDNFRLDWFY